MFHRLIKISLHNHKTFHRNISDSYLMRNGILGPSYLRLCTFCYRTFPVLGWACSFPSAQQACRSFFRVIYVGGPLKCPQLTTIADTLTPTRYCVISLILFVNWNVFNKIVIRFCLIYSNNQWKMQKLIEVTTVLGVNIELHTNLVL